MTKVFIAGSRRLSKLSKDVKSRIDNIIDRGFTTIVGDANGIDKAVQQHLQNRRYRNVVIYCMEGHCRNNVGEWPVQTVTASAPSNRNFAYYSTKDRAMVSEADYGLMLWDGRSKGTLTSIIGLLRRGKPVVVYLAPDRMFCTLRSSDQLPSILSRVDSGVLMGVDHELKGILQARNLRFGRH